MWFLFLWVFSIFTSVSCFRLPTVHRSLSRQVGIRVHVVQLSLARSLLVDKPAPTMWQNENQDSIQNDSQEDELVEEVTHVKKGFIIEFIANGRLEVGIVRNEGPGLKSISAAAFDGDNMWSIDLAQIVSVWTDVDLSNKEVGQSVRDQAESLIAGLPPSDLEEFWATISRMRSRKLVVDAVDLAVYLFQEPRFERWLNPFLPAEEARVRPLTAVQMFAAALLLHRDEVHFKRRPTVLADAVLQDTENCRMRIDEVAEQQEVVAVVEGGYRVLEESVVLQRECALFEQYYTQHREAAQGSSAATIESTPPCVSRILRQLELLALSDAKHSDTTATVAEVPKLLRMVLKRLDFPVSARGAKQMLMTLRRSQSNCSLGSTGTETSHHTTQGTALLGAGITPWTPAVVQAAQQLAAAVERDRVRWANTPPGPAGKRSPSGRMDLRASGSAHPALCIDTKHASFLDDAFSLSPETGELMVHIADVAGRIRQYEALQQVAKERVSSAFLASGPVHMLPPTALSALALSAEGGAANEVLTVALSVDPASGQVLRFRAFPSVLGPVYPLDMRSANEILAEAVEVEGGGGGQRTWGGNNTELADASVRDTSDGTHGGKNTPLGNGSGKRTGKVRGLRIPRSPPSVDTLAHKLHHPAAVVEDLQTIYGLVDTICARQPWLDSTQRQDKKQASEWQYDPRSGRMRTVETGNTLSQRLVGALLSLYSAVALEFCTSAVANKGRALPVPIVWENRDREDTSKVRRFATQPLRNWISQLQQKQLRAALHMELPLNQKECALAVLHHNHQRRLTALYADRRTE